MLPKLKLNDVVVAEDLRVYYFKDNKSEPFPTIEGVERELPEIGVSSEGEMVVFEIKEGDHMGAQFMTDNLDLVLRKASNLHKTGEYPLFDHYAEDVDKEVTIQYGVNVAFCNDKKVLFIKNLSYPNCLSLYNKIIKLHKVLQ